MGRPYGRELVDYNRRSQEQRERSTSSYSNHGRDHRRNSPWERRREGREREDDVNKMVQAMKRMSSLGKKIDPVPIWEKNNSFISWKRRITRWADNEAKPNRKAEMFLSSLKKNCEKTGLKEMAKAEFEENPKFDFYDKDIINNILKVIEEFVDESKFTRIMNTTNEYNEFEKKHEGSHKEYISRFTTLKSKLRNVDSGMSNTWMAVLLIDRSKLSN